MFENTAVFKRFLSLLRGFPLSQPEVGDLKNTVWKTLFGTLRLLSLHPCKQPFSA